MKKMIIALLAAALMSLGLVSFAGSPAQAACPYQGCAETKTTLKGPDSAVAKYKWVTKKKKRVLILSDGPNLSYDVSTKVIGGGPSPKGDLIFNFDGDKSTKGAPSATFNTGELEAGKYTIKASYVKKDGSAFYSSTADSITLKVTKKVINKK